MTLGTTFTTHGHPSGNSTGSLHPAVCMLTLHPSTYTAGALPGTILKMITSGFTTDLAKDAASITVRKPDWGATADPSNKHLKATWLGHASFAVELEAPPSPEFASRGIRVLFDPVFSDRCSPVQFMGPARFTRRSTTSRIRTR
jgi:hypothetical protein